MNTYDIRTPATTPARDKGYTLSPASPAQFQLISDMAKERGIDVAATFRRPANWKEAKVIIGWLKAQPRKEASSPAVPAQEGGKTYTAPKLPVGKRGYGYYAIPAGELGFDKPHFFRVKTAKGTGFQYLDEKASNDLYPVRGARRAKVMEWLAANDKLAGALYGELLGNCRFCHKDLTDENNPYKALGAGPDCGPKYL